ncbi:MAG: twitching motility protein [Candidatus Berkelbacteria bacterium Athens1014_28]|uniref:Twitching motility protein n=1 Tax=Candidatus Berkelbacteria bacterium Athens1014_28 TaxID=2017145 RepID=A0A554LN80_9BACT|nr:MAG: twitching motility protein [Candidatus Berkelbacteria bacterium Athens1014_28]
MEEEKDSKKFENFSAIFDLAISKGASDIHIVVGSHPLLRIDGRLLSITGIPPLDKTAAKKLLSEIASEEQLSKVSEKQEVDFSFEYKDNRFRTNIYLQRDLPSASLRLIPSVVKSYSELGLPPIIEYYVGQSQGLVIVTGPTGHGKSTTLASMVDQINKTRREHIITIEDPVEYVFKNDKSLISQREVGSDTKSFSAALRGALREDPNVVLIGEMRDLETIESALIMAETGHLVLTTLHTNSAAQTIDRIVSVFPAHQQQQILSQLASVLLGVVSQRLIPKISGGRVVACEIMVANPAIRNLIRDNKIFQIPSVIQTSASEGMILLDKVLAELVSRGDVSLEDALTWSISPKTLKMMVY